MARLPVLRNSRAARQRVPHPGAGRGYGSALLCGQHRAGASGIAIQCCGTSRSANMTIDTRVTLRRALPCCFANPCMRPGADNLRACVWCCSMMQPEAYLLTCRRFAVLAEGAVGDRAVHGGLRAADVARQRAHAAARAALDQVRPSHSATCTAAQTPPCLPCWAASHLSCSAKRTAARRDMGTADVDLPRLPTFNFCPSRMSIRVPRAM